MVSFPFCKINLGLHILARRNDGFHNIETCFYPIPWTDILEVIPSDAFKFTCSGVPVRGEQADNVCVKAWNLLKQDHGIPPVSMHLHKVIPAGAGLGGGSSDGAHALKILNEIFSLALSDESMSRYASLLGSDCAFFLKNVPALGFGKGDELSPQPISLRGKFALIIKPEIHVPTGQAYGGVKPQEHALSVSQILERPLSFWRETLANDFESSIFERYPAIAKIKETLYSIGASYASLSGSGASVFGLFDSLVEIPVAFKGMTTFQAELK